MKFRALCTDIDGTLLDHNRQLSPRTIKAIKSLDKNIPVILASSRMPSAMRHLQKELGILHHPLICFNGGYIIYFHNQTNEITIVDSIIIPTGVCIGIVALTANTAIHSSLYFEDNWYAPLEDQWTEREARITKVSPVILSSEQVFERWAKQKAGAHKVMCMGPAEELNELERLLNINYGIYLNIYRSRDTYIEIAPKTISKGTALQKILKLNFNIDCNDVIAFGDNFNDIDLLKTVGHGVAVANARDEVKKVAKEIADDSKQDGVAKLIEKYFL